MPKNFFRWTRVRSWGVPAVAAVAGAGLGAGAMALWGTTDEPAQAAFSVADAGQQTVTVGLQTLEESVSASGTLAAVTTDSLAFEASGEVITVNVEAGDVVAAGDVIAEIDTLQLTASLRSAEADLAQAQASLADLEDAADGSDASDAQIASAEAKVAVLTQTVADAGEAMSDAQLVADIGGLLTSQPYAVGDVVSSGSSASTAGGTTQVAATTSTSSGVTIVGQDEWTVSVSLSEDEVAKISEGDQVTFTTDDADDFYGIVTDIANLPTTTGGSATYAVALQVTGAVEGMYEGTSVTADIVYLRQVDVLAIPTNAITTVDGVSTVTVVDDAGTETEREITVGDAVGSYTEILDGLTEGEQLVVTVTTSATTGSTDDTEQWTRDMPAGGFGDGTMPDGMGGAPGN